MVVGLLRGHSPLPEKKINCRFVPHAKLMLHQQIGVVGVAVTKIFEKWARLVISKCYFWQYLELPPSPTSVFSTKRETNDLVTDRYSDSIACIGLR